MAYLAYGSKYSKFGMEWEVSATDYLFSSMFCEMVEGLLEKGMLVPHPIKEGKGGLEGVNGGLDEMRAGKLRGTKLVFGI